MTYSLNMVMRITTAPYILLLAGLVSPASAQLSLHERIDQLIAAGTPDFQSQAVRLAPDAEFLRRIYLDLTGTIPTSAEARAFLDDPLPDKRAQLIDRLLDSPEYARRMQQVFDVVLMERRGDKHIPAAQWREYLRRSFAENKPWDRLVREILLSDGADSPLRPAAKFYLDREGQQHLLTRDIGRVFLGIDLQCAQCHDHPIVDDYPQEDYYGIYAFLNRSYVFTDKKKKKAFIAEKGEGEVSYVSVFEPKVTYNAEPRLPGAKPVEEPDLEKGKEYKVPPKDGQRAVPRYSRRLQLARLLPGPDNAAFNRNIINRLWAVMMGRGLVEPVDMHHSDNPPSHPELLGLLADQFAAGGFDIKTLLRELALSQTYQRSSELPEGVDEVPTASFAVALLKPLSPEQLALSMMQATGVTDLERKTLGQKLDEQTLYAKLDGHVGQFVSTFGSPPGQSQGTFQATLQQALFLSNGPLVGSWLEPKPGNLVDRLAKLSDAREIVEELYLSVLTRRPTEPELVEVAEYLKSPAADRTAALRELAWALLASAEFRFNH